MILGADFSSYQPNVDWPTYLTCGRSFALIKATEGTSYLNPLFQSQIDGAEAAGIAVGCFHYYSWTDPAQEARWFVRNVKNVTVLTGVPLAVDFERGSYPIPTNAQWHFDTMLAEVELLAGYPPLWYSSSGFLNPLGIIPPSRNGQWIAIWGPTPPEPIAPASVVAIWQHAASQSIPGSLNPTDSDVFFGSVEQFRAYGGR